MFIVLGRMIICVIYGYWPPISLWGRIWTGHLIIPRYDKVFISPIVIIMTGIFVPRLLISIGLNNTLAFELSFFCVLFESFILPPKLKDWRLTGAHRIVQMQNQQSRLRKYHSWGGSPIKKTPVLPDNHPPISKNQKPALKSWKNVIFWLKSRNKSFQKALFRFFFH